MSKVIVIGAGAAGMMAAITARRSNDEVIIFEKNEKAGKKVYITGKGRCNITNACDTEDLINNILSNKNFMYSSLYTFTNFDTMDFFEELGCKIKVERGNRVFPQSDKSSDVISALTRELKRLGVDVYYNTPIVDIVCKDGVVSGVKTEKSFVKADKVIVATGGMSYPTTGSTGDGYKFAKKLGHTVTKLSPSLVPFNIKGQECQMMQGLSLKNIELSLYKYNKEANKKKVLYKDFGEMLFTHFGVSGPVVLSSSCHVSDTKDLFISVDLKPALSKEQLDARILRDFGNNQNKSFKNSLDDLLPKKMIPIIIERSGIDPEKKVNEVKKEERKHLIDIIKDFEFEVVSLRGYNEAVITKGGVSVKEVDPSTMESKKVKGLYFAGEVLDIDAYTGGYNLQIAWSTGHQAGQNFKD